MEKSSSWLENKIASYGNRTAIIHNNVIYTYHDLLAECGKCKDRFQSAGIKSGEVVAILADYSLRSIAAFLALVDTRTIIVPITTKNEDELQVKLQAGQVEKLITVTPDRYTIVTLRTNADRHPIIRELQMNGYGGLIIFSSGSTGLPKAMVHNLNNLLGIYKDKKSRELIILLFLMFDHIGGLNTLFNALSMGATVVIPTTREVDGICDLISRYDVNLLPASPTFLNLILISEAHRKYDLSSLRMITYGTEVMSEGLLARLKAKFRNVKFLQTFGTSETGIAQTSSKSSDSTYIRIDDRNLEYKFVQNELWLRSKTQILGYLNHASDGFTEDGWFKTGDMVEVSKDGFIRITGRTSEIINVGGEKVLPEEVETVLLGLTQIVDCRVYGEKNAITGQMVVADVVVAEGLDESEIRSQIRKHCSVKLERYKMPAKINITQNIPFSNRFKKTRKEL